MVNAIPKKTLLITFYSNFFLFIISYSLSFLDVVMGLGVRVQPKKSR